MTDTTRPHDRLAFALARVLAIGSRPPCGDGSGAWVSDDRDERAMAARLCARCPLIVECAEAADSTKERFGVWAGVDRTQPASNKRKGPRECQGEGSVTSPASGVQSARVRRGRGEGMGARVAGRADCDGGHISPLALP